MLRTDKERIVAELAERLRGSQALIVADYRGLSMPQIDALRTELLKHGARFSVVKNTLTRRAAEEAGADALLGLLEGPTAIAFLETEGDPVAVAKALGSAARETRVIAIRGGVLEGKTITAEEVERLATLPPADVLRAQLLGAITAPLTTIVGLFTAPLQNLVGLIDARITQLESEDEGSATAEPQADTQPQPEPAPAEDQPEPEAEAPPEGGPAAEEDQPEAEAAAEPQAEAQAEEATEPANEQAEEE